MKLLIEQINPKIGDIEANTFLILSAIQKAQEFDCQILVLPELALCGYPPKDLLLLEGFLEKVEESLEKICHACKNLMAVIGLPRKDKGKLLNSAAIIQDQKLIAFEDKSLLPNYDVFNERRYFSASTRFKQVFKYKTKKIAVCICEDIWMPCDSFQSPLSHLKNAKIDLLINLSSSPFSLQKFEKRLFVAQDAAKKLDTQLVLCNQAGGNDSLIFDGKSFHLDRKGNVQKKAKGFCQDSLVVSLDQENKALKINDVESEEDLFEALICGLKDYFDKCAFKSACLGLSGGIDSALVACLAQKALGPENITAIAMPSRYSSKESLEDAKALAKNLKIELHTIPIDHLFQSFIDTLAPFFAAEGLCEENLQARIRGMLLMAFSNTFGHVLLSTGNKSEIAMGYTTLYGDLCGGLSVISDLCKEQVYTLCRWINKKELLIPERVFQKEPSAELRPNQKDRDSLPPYPDIDNVLKAYVEEHQSIPKIAKRFSYEEDFVHKLVQKIHQSEYKRRQSAPGFKVSEKAFSEGWIFPIVQGWIKTRV